MQEYDLVVIGAGPGGTPVAMMSAKFGKRVLLIDKLGKAGGECLFEGCIPSKILENASNRYAMLKNASEFHIDLKSTPQIHWEEVIAEKERILKMRSESAMKQIDALATLDFVKGKATFKDAHTISVNDKDYSFKQAVIATGATASMPPLSGDGVAKAWTNADIFKQTKLPKEIAFIGAGAISCELVQMFAKLGVKCHILERGERILKRIDKNSALIVQKRMQEQGIDVILNVTFKEITGKEGNFTISYEQNGNTKELKVPNVLIATGREANVEGLGLENIDIEYDKHGIKTDKTMQTTQPHIYAIGDCAVGPKFAHWATYTAGIAVHNLFAPTKHEADISKLSWVLFSEPQIASVGLSQAEAVAKGIEVDVIKYDYAIDARAQIDHDTDGMLQFVIQKSDGVIIGIQIVSSDASSLSGEASLIVSQKMKAVDVMGAIHPHPTLNEAFGKLAQNYFFASMMRGRGGR